MLFLLSLRSSFNLTSSLSLLQLFLLQVNVFLNVLEEIDEFRWADFLELAAIQLCHHFLPAEIVGMLLGGEHEKPLNEFVVSKGCYDLLAVQGALTRRVDELKCRFDRGFCNTFWVRLSYIFKSIACYWWLFIYQLY